MELKSAMHILQRGDHLDGGSRRLKLLKHDLIDHHVRKPHRDVGECRHARGRRSERRWGQQHGEDPLCAAADSSTYGDIAPHGSVNI